MILLLAAATKAEGQASAPPQPTWYVRLHAVLVSDSNGAHPTAHTRTTLARMVKEANQRLAPTGVQLAFDPDRDASDVADDMLNRAGKLDCESERKLAECPNLPDVVDDEGKPVSSCARHREEWLTGFRQANPPTWPDHLRTVVVLFPGNAVCDGSFGTEAFVDFGDGPTESDLFVHELGHHLRLQHPFSEKLVEAAAASSDPESEWSWYPTPSALLAEWLTRQDPCAGGAGLEYRAAGQDARFGDGWYCDEATVLSTIDPDATGGPPDRWVSDTAPALTGGFFVGFGLEPVCGEAVGAAGSVPADGNGTPGYYFDVTFVPTTDNFMNYWSAAYCGPLGFTPEQLSLLRGSLSHGRGCAWRTNCRQRLRPDGAIDDGPQDYDQDGLWNDVVEVIGGVPTLVRHDLCPLDPDPTNRDSDGDGVGDACDNCIQANPDQADADEDGLGDACEGCADLLATGDADADGCRDGCDLCPGDNRVRHPLDSRQQPPAGPLAVPLAEQCADRDGDGVGDACDNCPETRNASQSDCDHDGVGDACAGKLDPEAVCIEADLWPEHVVTLTNAQGTIGCSTWRGSEICAANSATEWSLDSFRHTIAATGATHLLGRTCSRGVQSEPEPFHHAIEQRWCECPEVPRRDGESDVAWNVRWTSQCDERCPKRAVGSAMSDNAPAPNVTAARAGWFREEWQSCQTDPTPDELFPNDAPYLCAEPEFYGDDARSGAVTNACEVLVRPTDATAQLPREYDLFHPDPRVWAEPRWLWRCENTPTGPVAATEDASCTRTLRTRMTPIRRELIASRVPVDGAPCQASAGDPDFSDPYYWADTYETSGVHTYLAAEPACHSSFSAPNVVVNGEKVPEVFGLGGFQVFSEGGLGELDRWLGENEEDLIHGAFDLPWEERLLQQEDLCPICNELELAAAQGLPKGRVTAVFQDPLDRFGALGFAARETRLPDGRELLYVFSGRVPGSMAPSDDLFVGERRGAERHWARVPGEPIAGASQPLADLPVAAGAVASFHVRAAGGPLYGALVGAELRLFSSSGTLVRTHAIPGAIAMTATPSGQHAVVVTNSKRLLLVTADTGAKSELGFDDGFDGPPALAVAPDGSAVWALGETGGVPRLLRASLEPLALTLDVAADAGAKLLAVDAAGTAMVGRLGTGKIQRFDPDGIEQGGWELPDKVVAQVGSPVDAEVLFAALSSGALHAVERGAPRLLTTFASAPEALTLSPDGLSVQVRLPGGALLSVDALSGVVRSVANVPGATRQVALPDGRSVLVGAGSSLRVVSGFAVDPRAPAAREDATLLSTGPGRPMLLVGGWANDLWRLHPPTGRWEPLPAPWGEGPGKRLGASVTLDRSTGRVWLVGGEQEGARLGELWELSFATWSWELVLESRYLAVTGAALLHDPSRGRLLIFGGEADEGLTGRLLSYEPFARRLLDVTPGAARGGPSPVTRAALLPDPRRGVVTAVGGDALRPPNFAFAVRTRELGAGAEWRPLWSGL